MSQRPLYCLNHSSKGRWVGCVGQRVQKRGTLLWGEVKLSRGAVGNINCNHTSDFFSERLNRDCHRRLAWTRSIRARERIILKTPTWLPFEIGFCKSPCCLVLEWFARILQTRIVFRLGRFKCGDTTRSRWRSRGCVEWVAAFELNHAHGWRNKVGTLEYSSSIFIHRNLCSSGSISLTRRCLGFCLFDSPLWRKDLLRWRKLVESFEIVPVP